MLHVLLRMSHHVGNVMLRISSLVENVVLLRTSYWESENRVLCGAGEGSCNADPGVDGPGNAAAPGGP